MSPPTTPLRIAIPEDWTAEQAIAVHDLLEALLQRIETHYGFTVQAWMAGEDSEPRDFDDPLPF